LWGHIKNNVYLDTFQNVEELENSVLAAFNSIDPEMLGNVLDATVRRAYLCLENEGSLFEHRLF